MLPNQNDAKQLSCQSIKLPNKRVAKQDSCQTRKLPKQQVHKLKSRQTRKLPKQVSTKNFKGKEKDKAEVSNGNLFENFPAHSYVNRPPLQKPFHQNFKKAGRINLIEDISESLFGKPPKNVLMASLFYKRLLQSSFLDIQKKLLASLER